MVRISTCRRPEDQHPWFCVSALQSQDTLSPASLSSAIMVGSGVWSEVGWGGRTGRCLDRYPSETMDL